VNNFLKISTDGAILKTDYDDTRPRSALESALRQRRKKKKKPEDESGSLF